MTQGYREVVQDVTMTKCCRETEASCGRNK